MLAAKFWPGPLTMVLRRVRTGRWAVAQAVAAGGDTIGLRVPGHPMALQLLREFASPVAAPSANRSSMSVPTTAAHVRDDLGDRVEMILDGGPSLVGIESTVIDLTGSPTMLRPGQISREQIELVLDQPVLSAGSKKLKRFSAAPADWKCTTPRVRRPSASSDLSDRPWKSATIPGENYCYGAGISR